MKEYYQFENGINTKPSWHDLLPDVKEEVDTDHFSKFFETMYERQEIWYKRFMLGKLRPWTNDVHLANHKFTNVYRELDRASQFLIKTVLLDFSLSLEDLLFRLMIFRFYNQPSTFTHNVYFVELPHYKNFDWRKLWLQTKTYREKVDNPWHTAYLMNLAFLQKPEDWEEKTHGKFKDWAYCHYAFQAVHKIIPELAKTLKEAQTPQEIIKLLETLPAVSSFQSHEFFIDFCYVNKYWKQKIMKFDENSYTNVGPGASLGLRLIFPSLTPDQQIKGIYTLKELAPKFLNKSFKAIAWDSKNKEYSQVKGCNIALHQIEMWLCEYSKYWKMTIKVGKQRSKFFPQNNTSELY